MRAQEAAHLGEAGVVVAREQGRPRGLRIHPHGAEFENLERASKAAYALLLVDGRASVLQFHCNPAYEEKRREDNDEEERQDAVHKALYSALEGGHTVLDELALGGGLISEILGQCSDIRILYSLMAQDVDSLIHAERNEVGFAFFRVVRGKQYALEIGLFLYGFHILNFAINIYRLAENYVIAVFHMGSKKAFHPVVVRKDKPARSSNRVVPHSVNKHTYATNLLSHRIAGHIEDYNHNEPEQKQEDEREHGIHQEHQPLDIHGIILQDAAKQTDAKENFLAKDCRYDLSY